MDIGLVGTMGTMVGEVDEFMRMARSADYDLVDVRSLDGYTALFMPKADSMKV